MAVTKAIGIIITIIISSTLLSTSILVFKNSLAQTQFLTYENKDFGFSIHYPSDWERENEMASKSSNINIVASFVKKNGKCHLYTGRLIYKDRRFSWQKY